MILKPYFPQTHYFSFILRLKYDIITRHNIFQFVIFFKNYKLTLQHNCHIGKYCTIFEWIARQIRT